MAYLLIPKETETRRATVWLAAVSESADLDLSPVFLERGSVRLDIRDNWLRIDQPFFIRHKSVILDGLEPGRRYALSFIVDDKVMASGEVTTLPESLPTREEKPFTVLLASCFWHERDIGVGNRFAQLPGQAKPDLKILCGDQVYLDAPASHYSVNSHSRAELELNFLSTYLASWSDRGLGDLLRAGANYFTADDHELWNNAPNVAPLVRDSQSESGRETWLELAKRFFRVFQSESAVSRFRVGKLSFCIAETRLDRDADQHRFMRSADLNVVVNWVRNLDGPGVLVVGQPVFASGAPILGHLFDFGLPDYRQYEDLTRALIDSQHDVVVLTGDVHYARVATCKLPSERNLYEIISSPLALVSELVGRKWSAAPEKFPAVSVSGVKALDVFHLRTNDDPFQETDEHFVTLHFAADGAKVHMTAQCWRIGPDHVEPREMCVLNLM